MVLQASADLNIGLQGGILLMCNVLIARYPRSAQH